MIVISVTVMGKNGMTKTLQRNANHSFTHCFGYFFVDFALILQHTHTRTYAGMVANNVSSCVCVSVCVGDDATLNHSFKTVSYSAFFTLFRCFYCFVYDVAPKILLADTHTFLYQRLSYRFIDIELCFCEICLLFISFLVGTHNELVF